MIEPRYQVKRSTRKSATVTFFGTFTVTTPALTRIELEELAREQIEMRQRGSTDSFGRLDADTVTNIAYAEADRYVSDWDGCTPDIFEAFGVELEAYPATNGDGSIHFDRDLARILWRHAPRNQFADVIVEKSSSINATHFYSKKKQPSSAENSSAPT